VSHTEVEIESLAKVLKAHDWQDVTRRQHPPDEKVYTWWSYRARDWQASNRGRRLDHIWASPALAPSFETVEIVRAARGWKKPSDHVPIMASFNA
jgi:exodeoxyribonuclease III